MAKKHAFVVKAARRYLRPPGVSTRDWEQHKVAMKETVSDAESVAISFSDGASDEDTAKTRRKQTSSQDDWSQRYRSFGTCMLSQVERFQVGRLCL